MHEQLTEKTRKKSGFWKDKAKFDYGCKNLGIDSKQAEKFDLKVIHKKGRTDLRKQQIRLSSILLTNLINKEIETAKQSAKNLHNFYKNTLNDMQTFTNISKKENPKDFDIVNKAHEKMLLLIK